MDAASCLSARPASGGSRENSGQEADGTLSVPRINVGRDAAPPM